MLIIGISGKRGQGKSRFAVALASRFKRCAVISVYDIVKFFRDYQCAEERDAIVEQIRDVRGNYLTDSLKLRIAMSTPLYDVFIIDDIFDSALMNQIKTELNAQIIGVEKVSLHKLPLMIRDNLDAGRLGEPDYAVNFTPNYSELSKEIDRLLSGFMEKGLMAENMLG